jgi:hypothetical protein
VSGTLTETITYEILANADELKIDSDTIHKMVKTLLSRKYYPGALIWLDPKIFYRFLKPFVVENVQSKSEYAVPMLQYCIDNGIVLDYGGNISDLVLDALNNKKEDLALALLKYSARNKAQLNVNGIREAIVANNFWGIILTFLKNKELYDQSQTIVDLVMYLTSLEEAVFSTIFKNA